MNLVRHFVFQAASPQRRNVETKFALHLPFHEPQYYCCTGPRISWVLLVVSFSLLRTITSWIRLVILMFAKVI